MNYSIQKIFLYSKKVILIFPKLFIILLKDKLIKKCQLKILKKITIITNYIQTNANLNQNYILYQRSIIKNV